MVVLWCVCIRVTLWRCLHVCTYEQVRGTESLTLIKPRPFNLSILGVGNSVGTSKVSDTDIPAWEASVTVVLSRSCAPLIQDGITAAVVVVKDYAELKGSDDGIICSYFCSVSLLKWRR